MVNLIQIVSLGTLWKACPDARRKGLRWKHGLQDKATALALTLLMVNVRGPAGLNQPGESGKYRLTLQGVKVRKE